jgi:DNA-binding GntR family transcriptional regulator
MDDVTKPRLLNSEAGDLTLASQRVTESIRDLILSGEMAPGSRIRQEELAERFGTSRIPVREALRRLESDGLVRLVPNASAWVAKIDMGECIEVYKIRELVEPLALSESVSRMTDHDIEELEKHAARLDAATTTEEFLRLDREFHLASYRPADMQQLFPIIERFWNTTQQYRRAFTKLLGDEGSWIIHWEHRLLMEAIRRRDAVGASHILYEHVRRTRFELERNREILDSVDRVRSARR